MKHQRTIQFAVMCLQELDAQAGKTLSLQEISERRGIPLPECREVIGQLSHAGIVELPEAGRVVLRRPVEELTALDILEAVWRQNEPQMAFQMLIGGESATQKTLDVVRRNQARGFDSALNG